MPWRVAGGILVGLLALTVRVTPREEWLWLIGLTGLLTIGVFGWIKTSPASLSIWEILTWALVFRLTTLGVFPSWSDDVFRFYWDAWVAKLGGSPYAQTPRDGLPEMPPMAQAIFPQLNSPDYYSVYLPWHQTLFRLALGEGSNVHVFALKLQGIYTFIELICWGIILKLSTMDWISRWKWILWNPILILEFIGNLHVEGLLVVFLVLSWTLYLSTSKMWISIVPFVMAIAWKWTPLVWVPLLWVAFDRSNRWKALLFGVVSLPIFTWSLWPEVSRVGASLDLYFQRFEFNASVYYLFRDMGIWILGYNPIQILGPWLSGLTVFGILYWAWRHPGNGRVRAYYSYTLYLALATTVHPWYALPWMVVSVLSGRSAGWVGLWFMSWSYHAYSHPEQPIWAYACLGCWILGEEIIFWRTPKLPAKHGLNYLHKFFQYLSPSNLAEVKRQSNSDNPIHL